jgi:large subunit ribosomal protein L9
MKVILLEELKGRGGEGDVIEVATGYAVNFLFPRKIAVTATSGNLKQLEQRKHNIAKREENRLDTADKLVAALEGQRIRLGAKVGDEGQLFGSVTPVQVADAINAKFDTAIDRRRIDLHGIVKTAGEHSATISIYRDLKATVIIDVVDEKALAAEAAALVAAATAEVAEAEAAVAAEAAVEAAEAEVEVAAEDAVEVAIEVAEAAAEVAAEVAEAAAEVAEADTDESTVAEALEAVEEKLEDVARTLAEAADAAEPDEAADAEAVADAATELLQEIEGALDATVADAVVAEVVDAAEDAADAPE